MTDPPRKQLATYLCDHFAGSEAALELMDDIATSYAHSAAAVVVAGIRPELLFERAVLRKLLDDLDASPSTTRRIFGWLAEKFAERKLRADDPDTANFRLLESLEILSLGISGKIALWYALERCRDVEPAVATLNFQQLLSMAHRQRERVESVRTDAARAAFSDPRLYGPLGTDREPQLD